MNVMMNHIAPIRIAIVGAGHVGSTLAYALLLNGLAAEIVLIDRDRERAIGEAADLSDGVPFTLTTRIKAGELADCAGAAVTVVTAGAAQHAGETRLELAGRNIAIIREVVPVIVQHNPEGTLVVATNPVDVMSYAAWRLAGVPAQCVIGSGTILDTARFRRRLAEHYGIDPRSVHAYIIGEHGDSEVPVWSRVRIAGMTLQEFCAAQGRSYDQNSLVEIFQQTRDAAYRIIERKGATYYAIAAGLVRLLEAIVRDQHTVLPVSTYVEEYHGVSDVYLSIPAIVGRCGVERLLHLPLTDEEAAALRRSASSIRGAWERLALIG